MENHHERERGAQVVQELACHRLQEVLAIKLLHHQDDHQFLRHINRLVVRNGETGRLGKY